MTAKDINNALYRHFANYEYKLNNTFVFNWESDFFAQSKSGYFIECEIKVSRSDFFIDFKKEKHRLFQDVVAGRSHHVYRFDPFFGDGDLLQESKWINVMTHLGRPIDTKEPLIERTYNNRFHTFRGKKVTVNTFKEREFIVNDWMNRSIKIGREYVQEVHAKTSRILIETMDKIQCPHQFYYIVPEGLIKLEELPKYAGLLIVKPSGEIASLKRAPYLHKRSMDLSRTLLKKYYNLWQYKVPQETKLAIRSSYSE